MRSNKIIRMFYFCTIDVNVNPGTPEYRNTYKKTYFVTYL